MSLYSIPSPFTRLTHHSPQDHAILEAAYLKNSKPDKSERAQIVSQVNMSEKEVQVRSSPSHPRT